VAYDPTDPTPVIVEAYVGGAWVAVTSRTRAATTINIDRGQSPGSIQPESDTMSCTIENADGYLTEDNPLSPWYPDMGRGCKIRVSLTGILVGDAIRFQGRIDTMEARYPDGVDSVMDIAAIGTWGVLVQSAEPLTGALGRAILADSPVAFWALDDGPDATSAGPGVSGGTAMTASVGTPEFAATVGPAGSSGDLVLLTNPAELRGAVPAGTATSAWAVEWIARVDDQTLVDGKLMRFTTSTIAVELYGQFQSGATVFPMELHATGTGYTVSETLAEIVDWQAAWHHYLLTCSKSGGDVTMTLYVDGVSAATSTDTSAVTVGYPAVVRPNYIPSELSLTASYGYVGVYNHVAIDAADRYQAMLAWLGERADVRMQRLCDEEVVDIEITGTSTVTMGVQTSDTLPNLLEECALADGGLLADGGTDGALTYVCQSELYNAVPAVEITAGTIKFDIAPRWDRQDVGNDITARIPAGSSYRATDEDHITRTNARVKRSPPLNLESADDLPNHAHWRLHLGTLPGPRYPRWTINMPNSDAAALAPDIVVMTPGSRITVAESVLPDSLTTGGMDQLILGWTERLDAYGWEIDPHTRPWGHDIGVYGVDPDGIVSRYGAATTVLAEDLTDVETAADVTATGETWATTATHASAFPFDVDIGGLTYSCTAITGTSPSYTLTLVRLASDKTHATGDAVTVTITDAVTGRYGL
jgi:hypothetical protein